MDVREFEILVDNLVFIFILLFALIIVISFIALIIQLILKKRRKLVSIGVMVFSNIVLVMLLLFEIQHWHTLQYNDWKIIGSNINDIEKKYGPFDHEDVSLDYCEIYYLYNNEFGDKVYYIMGYDDSGTVTSVTVREYPWF